MHLFRLTAFGDYRARRSDHFAFPDEYLFSLYIEEAIFHVAYSTKEMKCVR